MPTELCGLIQKILIFFKEELSKESKKLVIEFLISTLKKLFLKNTCNHNSSK